MLVERAEMPSLPYPDELSIPGRDDVSLRLSHQDDTKQLFALMLASHVRLSGSQHLDVKGLTIDKTRLAIAKMLTDMKSGSLLQYRIMVGDEIAGSATLHHIDHEQHEAQVGYWIGGKFEGHGYASDATKRLIQYGFDEMGLEKVTFEIGADNEQSEAVAQRLGACLTDRTFEQKKGKKTSTYRIWELAKDG